MKTLLIPTQERTVISANKMESAEKIQSFIAGAAFSNFYLKRRRSYSISILILLRFCFQANLIEINKFIATLRKPFYCLNETVVFKSIRLLDYLYRHIK